MLRRYSSLLLTTSLRLYPSKISGNSCVDAWVVRQGTVVSPAGDSIEFPPSFRQADHGSSGVALARVLSTLRIPGADHIVGQLARVPVGLIALDSADDRNVDLVQ